MENLVWYLDFLSRSQVTEFKILGGEPSLHPELPEIIRLAAGRGFKVVMFTNGLWPESFARFVSDEPLPQLNFLFNVNEPYLQKETENQLQTAHLKIAGEKAQLGFNIYRDDFSLDFTVDLIGRYSLQKEIRLGLASPIIRTKNQFIPTSRLPQAAKRLVHQLRELEKKDILGALDCGFPLCIFDEADLGSLVLTTRSGFLSVCGSVIDVDADLKAWPCFPLSEIFNVSLKNFNHVRELSDYFDQKTAPLKQVGSMKECLLCKYRLRKQCTGGCLARTIQTWEEGGDPALLEKLALQC